MPTDADFPISNKNTALGELVKINNNGINKWCYASLNGVKKNINFVNYPSDKVHLIKGKVS